MPCNTVRSSPEQNASPAPRSTSTRQLPAAAVFHRGNQLKLHLRSHRISALGAIQSNRPHRSFIRNQDRCIRYICPVFHSPTSCPRTSNLHVAPNRAQSPRSPGAILELARVWALRARTPPIRGSMSPSEYCPPEHPARTDIRPGRRSPHRTAGSPPRTPRESFAAAHHLAAHADARQSRCRHARNYRQRPRDLFGRRQPDRIRQRDLLHAGVDQQIARARDLIDAPRIAVRISEGHRDIGHQSKPCRAPA
jgi:hypothetical protein